MRATILSASIPAAPARPGGAPEWRFALTVRLTGDIPQHGNAAMRRFFRLLVILPSVALPTGATANETFDRSYAIYRNGSEIGTRELRITRSEDGLQVVNETNIAVKIAFITVFRRHERLREIWRGGRLVRFSSQVNDDGEHFEVKAVRKDDGRLHVNGTVGAYGAPPGTLPATYWHEGIVGTDTLIHVMRGSFQRVETTLVGKETVTVNGEAVETRRYRMTGDERVDLWFDGGGLVVRVVYHNEDGTKIDFRARNSAAPPDGLALPDATTPYPGTINREPPRKQP